MGANSSIEWTESTWNPTTGCDILTPGCDHCYAERMSLRLKAMGQSKYSNGFQLTLHESALELPLTWKKPQRIFVNSMSDLFHHSVPVPFIQQVFATMTKAHSGASRARRRGRGGGRVAWSGFETDVWMGVSVETADYKSRIDHLRNTGAAIKFLSLEPLLGDLGPLDLSGIDWVIVGGESGPGARPVQPEWITGIRSQCEQAQVPFFFKRWGGVQKKRAGRTLDGRTWDELPQLREEPLHRRL